MMRLTAHDYCVDVCKVGPLLSVRGTGGIGGGGGTWERRAPNVILSGGRDSDLAKEVGDLAGAGIGELEAQGLPVGPV